MTEKFRVTCARTIYLEIEVEARDAAEAERMVDRLGRESPHLLERGRRLGRPMDRIVEIAAAEAEMPLAAKAAWPAPAKAA